jgi:hypothetical protein
MKAVLCEEENKVDNLLVKFDSFVLPDVLLTVPSSAIVMF